MKKELRAEARVKKADAKKKAETAKKLKIGALIAIPVLVIVAIIVVAFITKEVYSLEVDYSEGLTADGKIAGINVTDYVELCDYAGITIPRSEVEMTDDKLSEHLNSIIKDNDLEALTDEFIAENYADTGATTVDEYSEYIRTTTLEENVKDYIYNYLLENSTVTSYPKEYYKIMKKNTDRQYVAQFQYYNEMLAQYTGTYQWNSYLEYYGVSRSEYKDMIEEAAEAAVKESLVLQGIYEELGLSITDADMLDIVESLGYTADPSGIESASADYSLAYLNQITANNKVVEHLAEKVNFE